MTSTYPFPSAGQEFLSCPFCGGENIFIEPDERGSGGQWVAPIHVGCSSCKCEQHADDEQSAVAAWNTRAALTSASKQAGGEPSDAQIMDCFFKTTAESQGAYMIDVGRAILALSAPQPPLAGAGEAVQWPQSRDVGRIADMSPSAVMRVGFDGDNDVSVGVYDEQGSAVVEYCTPGSGAGKSSRTRRALIALMVAMEADNAEDPGRDWWALRASKGNPKPAPLNGGCGDGESAS